MIDHARLRELQNEVGEHDLAEVIALFCEEVEETLERLRLGSAPALADDLHFLKGSALNIGMSEVGDICKAAELALRSDPQARPDIDTISAAFQKARQALSSHIGA